MKRNLTKIDYKNKFVFVGLDVHQENWSTHIITEGIINKKNFVPDTKKLAYYLWETYPNATIKAVYEAGCFGFWIKEELDLLGIETIVVNPADIPMTGKDTGRKTDQLDSRKLAEYLQSGLLHGIYAPDKESQEHRSLVRRRVDLVKKKTRVKNQIKAMLKFYGIKYRENFVDSRKHWTKAFMFWLSSLEFRTKQGRDTLDSLLRELSFIKGEICIIMKEISLLSVTEKYASNFSVAESLPGFGTIVSMEVLTEVVDMTRFSNRDLFLSYLGLVPCEHSSGEKIKKGSLVNRCNQRLRSLLIEASWVAIRNDPALGLAFKKYCKRMIKTKAIINIASKLASRLRYLWLNKMHYELGVLN